MGTRVKPHKDGSIEAWGRWIFAETRGHPFFLIEYLKILAEQRELLRDEVGAVQIPSSDGFMHQEAAPFSLPASVRDFIHARLTRLSQTALTLCMAAAVLGDGCAFDQLRRVADIDENQALSAMDEAVTRGLLQETGDKCSFAHDSIREGAYAEAGESRRRVLHRRALETLQVASVSPAELARHALAAGLPDVAARLSIAAGDAAMRVFAARDAIAQYEQARQLVRRSNESPLSGEENVVVSLAELSRLYLQLGWAYELSSQFARAESLYEELLTLARALHEPVMECAALNRLATQAAQNSQDLARAEELLQQALAIAESSQNKAGVAETAWNLAQTGFYAAKMAASLPHAERALALARELKEQELIGRSLHALATLETALGRQEESLSHAEEARILYATLGNQVREVGCLCVIARANIDGGHLDEGIDAARKALAMSEAMEDTWGYINAAAQLVPGLLHRGAYGEAFAVGQEAVALARTLEITPLLVITLTEWGNVCRANLAPEAAKVAHNEALARCEGSMPPHYVGWIASELCADCVVAEQWQQAYTYALKADAARDPSILSLGGAARWYEIAALLWGGSADRAREEVRRLREDMNNKGRSALHYLRSLAVLAQFQGKVDSAVEHLQEAARCAEEVGLPGELWSLYMELGEMYQQQDDESHADQAFARAAEIIQALADTMEDQQQRTTFLSAPVVKRVSEHVRFLL